VKRKLPIAPAPVRWTASTEATSTRLEIEASAITVGVDVIAVCSANEAATGQAVSFAEEVARAANACVVHADPVADTRAAGWTPTSVDALSPTLMALAAGNPGGWIVTYGPTILSRLAPSTVRAVLITAGASPTEWTTDVRALRTRFDLVLADHRPGVARGLIAERMR
jgi:hypothetical protein